MSNLTANVNFSSLLETLPGFFHNFHPRDFLDVIIVAFFIYVVLIFIKQTRSYFIFNTFVLLFIITFLSRTFDLALSRKLFEPLVAFFAIIFVVVFQREIRRFFKWFVISRDRLSKKAAIITNTKITDAIVESVGIMSKKRVGALIVLAGEYPLDGLADSGFSLGGEISTPLILSLFDTRTPGHDGAVLIENKKIKSFGMYLPLSDEFRGSLNVGSRHRAAVGLSERTDAMVIVVSEERGTVSVAQNGSLRTVPDRESLESIVREFIKENPQETHSFWYYILVKNFLIKILSIIIALALWILLVFQGNISNRELSVPIEFSHIPPSVIVERVIPADVDVTVSGNTRDVSDLTLNDVHIVIDLAGATEGTTQFDITKDKVILPSYISVTNISPNRVLIGLHKVGP
jgi:diadenylate cyclase